MLWQLRREIAATTPPRKAILSGVSRAGVCSRIVWRSRVACTTSPMCLRFAATIRARWALGEAKNIFEELGDRSGAAWSTNQLADIAREHADLAAAQELYQRALSVFREAGDAWGSARSLTDLGYVSCGQGDHSAAQKAYSEALQIFLGLGHRRGMARALEGFACLALAQGRAARALTLAAAAVHLRELIGAPLPQAEQFKLDQTLLPAWKLLSGSEGKDAWAKGSSMYLEKSVHYCLEEPNSIISG
jgi:tetratricopeptide (TPR) repeat protein